MKVQISRESTTGNTQRPELCEWGIRYCRDCSQLYFSCQEKKGVGGLFYSGKHGGAGRLSLCGESEEGERGFRPVSSKCTAFNAAGEHLEDLLTERIEDSVQSLNRLGIELFRSQFAGKSNRTYAFPLANPSSGHPFLLDRRCHAGPYPANISRALPTSRMSAYLQSRSVIG